MMQELPKIPRSQIVFGELVYWITVLCAILCIVGPLIIFANIDNNVLNPHTLFGNIFDGMPTAAGVELEEDASVEDTVLHVKKTDNFEDMFDDLKEESGVILAADVNAGDIVLKLNQVEGFEAEKTIFINDEINAETATIASIDESQQSITLTEGLLYSYASQSDAEVAQVDEPLVTINDKETIGTKRVLRAINKEESTIIISSAVGQSYLKDNHAEAGPEAIWDKAQDGVEGGHYWTKHFTKGDGFTLFGMFLGCAVGIIAMALTGLYLVFKEKSSGWGAGAFFIAAVSFISMIGLIQTH